MIQLNKSDYNINSAKEYYAFLKKYLDSIDNCSFEQANAKLVFYLSFVTLYMEIPLDPSRNSFCIFLSGNSEQILYTSSHLLVASNIFKSVTLKTFLVSKLLSMLNLNVQLDNVNLKLLLGFVFVCLIQSKDNDDQAKLTLNDDSTKFDIHDITMDEDQNGNNISQINESILDILKSYSSFKIFYKILYFNNFIHFYTFRKNEIFNKYLNYKQHDQEPTDDEPEVPYEDVKQHEKLCKFYSLDHVDSTKPYENIDLNSDLEQELISEEHYYLTNCLINEKSILFADTTMDLDTAINSMTDEELQNSKSADGILNKIIRTDSEFKSIIFQHKRILLSKVYMKLLSDYLKLSSLSFNELIFVNSHFVLNFLLKNLSIFENEDIDEDKFEESLKRSNSDKRNSIRSDTNFNDKLLCDILQFEDYKKSLKSVNKIESKNLNELKFELLLALNEQYIIASHNQQTLQKSYSKLVLSKLLYYKHLKLIQIKTEINAILNSKIEINKNIEKAFNDRYQEEAAALSKLRAEQALQQQMYGSVTPQMEYQIDTDELYEIVLSEFKETFTNLTFFEKKFCILKDIFENNQFFNTGNSKTDNENFTEFLTILKKGCTELSVDWQLLSIDTVNTYLALPEEAVLPIIRPVIQNTVFNCLIGSTYLSDEDVKSKTKNLKEAATVYVNFVAFLIYSFNRQTNNCNKILILKILHSILKEMKKNNEKSKTSQAIKKLNRRRSIFTKDKITIDETQQSNENTNCDFYFNDLKVLVDIFIRELYNLSPETQVPVINNYLRVFFLLLDITPLNYLKHDPKYINSPIDKYTFNFDEGKGYKRKEILDLLLYLSGNTVGDLAKRCCDNDGVIPDLTREGESNSHDVAASEGSNDTKRLARKCLSISWLGLESYILENAQKLNNSTVNNGDFFPVITRTSTSNSMSSSSSSITMNANGSTDRLTLSKKLSNLRLSNTNTGGSNNSYKNGNNGKAFGQASPLNYYFQHKPRNNSLSNPSGYGNNQAIGSVTDYADAPTIQLSESKIDTSSMPNKHSNLNITNSMQLCPDNNTSSLLSIASTANNGKRQDNICLHPSDIRHHESHSSSNIDSVGTKMRKKPPPPPPLFSAASKERIIGHRSGTREATGGTGESSSGPRKSQAPPPPPPSRKLRVTKSALNLTSQS